MSSPGKSPDRSVRDEKSVEPIVSLRSVVRSVKDTVSVDLDGEAAILNLKNGVYYSLNPLGAKIWTLIQKTTLLSAVRDAILDEYEVEADVCERDLLDLIKRLASAGLVEVQAAGAPGNCEPVGKTV